MMRDASRRERCRAREAGLNVTEAALLLFVLVLLVAAVILGSSRGTTPTDTMAVEIQPGDTLWSLASSHPIAGLSTGEMVHMISEVNGLEGETLVAGAIIEIPAQGNAALTRPGDVAMR